MNTLGELLANPEPLLVPLVFDAISAKLAEQAGFKALYLGGGSLGYIKTVTEANLTPHDFIERAIEIRSICDLPLILDGAGGWGDPMHLHRTIGLAEAAGFAAIELEDQLLPKRAHHHAGIEHIISQDLMVAKIQQAVAARRNPNFLIIARTNATRTDSLDSALTRAAAYLDAGADMLFVLPMNRDQVSKIAAALPAPLMFMSMNGKFSGAGYSPAELSELGYQLIVDPTTPFLAMHKALRQSYEALAQGTANPLLGDKGARSEQQYVHQSIDLEFLLEIERRTVERPD
ncbi:MAG: isocitrate lyase/phosphoenolpyruvate mutase family protein [Pseudomonadales bacterium]|nr:isocitrate lyase/phosphoenolpyruvate mutase family protein [Pseudomonadales bacterium]